MSGEWHASAPVKAGKGLLSGGLLRDPSGQEVAQFNSLEVAKQCAAAMNLTTAKQRVDYCASKAGYGNVG